MTGCILTILESIFDQESIVWLAYFSNSCFAMSDQLKPTIEVESASPVQQMLPDNQEGLEGQRVAETEVYETLNSQVAIAESPLPPKPDGLAVPETPCQDLEVSKVPPVEGMSWTDLQLVQKQNYCQKCGELVDVTTGKAVRKKAHVKLTCKSCHNLVTMLYKNWDLKKLGFKEMSHDETKDFYRQCKETMDTDGRFEKGKIKVLLQQKLTDREVASTERSVKGKFLPLSVYASKGFDVGPIEQKAEKQVSDLFLVKIRIETFGLPLIFLDICYCYIYGFHRSEQHWQYWSWM